MNIRNNSIYLSDKAMFYARLLAKALLKDQGTTDQFCDAELIDHWEKEWPELQLAYEKNNELKQQNRKQYELAEKEILGSLTRTLEQQPSGDRQAAGMKGKSDDFKEDFE